MAIAALTAIGMGCARPPATPPMAPSAARLGPPDATLLATFLEMADTRRRDTMLVDRALKGGNPRLRAYAARAIGQVGMASRAPALRALVTDADSMIAADAAFSLGLLRDPDAIGVLGDALSGPPTVIDAAAWSLGEIGEPARAMLEDVVRSGRPRAAVAAALQATAKLRPVPAALVVPYLVDADPFVRRSAAYALTRARVPSATRALLAVANRSDAPDRPDGGSGSSPSVEVDFRSYVARGLARAAAGDSLADDAIAALGRLVDDPHPHVRINAIRSLATFGESARPASLRRLQDPDPNARIALAQSLTDVLAAHSSDWTVAWNADTGFTYRRSLLASAMRSGTRLPAVDSREAGAWQGHGDWRYRAAAAEAAGAGGVAEVDAIVAPLLRDPDPRVRNAAFNAASAWADSVGSAAKPYGRASLPAALADSDLLVRATILGVLRTRARAAEASVALDAWRRAARDGENDARVAALRVVAAAWAADSMSFTTAFRDSLARTAPPADPIERAAVRGVAPLGHWSRPEALAAAGRPMSWYAEQVRAFIEPDLVGRRARATVTTARGRIELELYGADAPLTVANFVALARRGYYDGLAFHRIVPNFVAQDGDPRGDGGGGPGYAIRDELNRRWYDRGAVAMALSGPDTGGSQYFLTHSPQPHLDGHYTVFGHVTAGFDVLDALVQGDRIVSITIQ